MHTHAGDTRDGCFEGWRNVNDSFDNAVMKSKRRSPYCPRVSMYRLVDVSGSFMSLVSCNVC